jgi:hypothetical protein
VRPTLRRTPFVFTAALSHKCEQHNHALGERKTGVADASSRVL